MRIAVMLRCIDGRGGIGIYARNIVEELLLVDPRNHYILLFRTPQHAGRYSRFPNVTTCVLPGANNALWDQWIAPRAAARERADVIFNPKFTLPLWGRAKAVMTVHGADWFLPDLRYLYHPIDRLYMSVAMPLYIRRSAAIISASDFSTQSFLKHLPSSRGKIRTIHYCSKGFFRPVREQAVLDASRSKYNLPARYLLTVIHYDTGRKNFANMLRAFERVRERGHPHGFVVCGRDVERYAQEAPLRDSPVRDQVALKGWVEQEDLPALYSQADLYLYPTRLEGFPIPITEALACGCPIVTSKEGVFSEAAGDAALYVDPESPAEIADAICRILDDTALRADLAAKALERAKLFNWETIARQTLAVFESLGPSGTR